MSSKFVAPSQHPGSTRNTLSNYKIVSSRMKIFLERRNSCITSISAPPTYISHSLRLISAELGVRLLHSKVRDADAKGVIDRGEGGQMPARLNAPLKDLQRQGLTLSL